MKKAVLIACLLATGLASPVLAANARNPYANCNKRVDNCGPTGDNMTEQLNAQQLGGGPGVQGSPGMPMQGGQSMPMQGGSSMPMQGGADMPMQGGPGMRH